MTTEKSNPPRRTVGRGMSVRDESVEMVIAKLMASGIETRGSGDVCSLAERDTKYFASRSLTVKDAFFERTTWVKTWR